jgi:hypothetical protein
MEGQAPEVTVAPIVAPAPVVQMPQSVVQMPQSVEPTQSLEDVGVFEGRTNSKWKMVDILIMSLWIIVPIYGIIYYRKAIKKLDEQPTTEEFGNIVEDIEEVKYNVKKTLGDKYKNT